MMNNLVNNSGLVLTSVLELYVVYRFMRIFFDSRSAKMTATIIMYSMYFIVGTIVMFTTAYPVINITSSIVLLFLITLCYEGTWSRRITTIVIIYMCMFLSEAVMAFVTGLSNFELFDQLENIDTYVSVVIKVILWVFTIILGKILKGKTYNMHLPPVFMVAIISVLVSTVFLETLIFQQPELNEILAAISLISVIVTNFMMMYLYDSLSTLLKERVDAELIKREKLYYHDQAELLQKNDETLKQFRHDMKNRIIVIKQMLEHQEIAEVNDYIEKMAEKLGETETFSSTGNVVVDSVVNYKLSEAKRKGIEVQANISIPSAIGIEDDDILIILGNLLDNAIEAAERLKRDKYIKVKMETEKNCLFIKVKNNYDHVVNKVDGKIVTRKENHTLHGIGLKSIQSTVNKYEGGMRICYNADEFIINVMLYGENEIERD